MPFRLRHLALLASFVRPLACQLPFYTDDPAVTAQGTWHFEFFNEYDVLQLQFPNVRQNTANGKLNYGLPHNLEVDVDFPYLAIIRAVEVPSATGGGDTNLGVKWKYHTPPPGSHSPILGVSFYIELPTGDATRQ